MADEQQERMCLLLFDGSDYSAWKLRMEILLEEHELLECVRTLASEVEDLKEAVGDSKGVRKQKELDREKRAKLDRKCKSLLVSRIHDSQLKYIQDEKHPKGIWDALRRVFERRSIASRMHLQRSMLTLRFEGGSLQQHFLQFDKLVREYRATGADLEELNVVCHLLLTLGSSYSAFITALETIPEENVSLDFVKWWLLREETKQKEVELYTLKNRETASIKLKQPPRNKSKEDKHKVSECSLKKEEKKKKPSEDIKPKTHLARGSGVIDVKTPKQSNRVREHHRDGILNNKVVTILSVALFAFIISTIALASSNQSKKEAIQQCQSEIVDLSPRCSVNPANDLPPQNEPVYLKHDGSSLQLWAPKGSTLVWNTTTEQTALLCSGTDNALEKTGLVLTEKTCLRGTQFTVAGAGETVGSKDLKCKTAVVGECVTSGQCGNKRGVLNKIGFNAVASGFITYIDACFNSDTSSVLYTRHILPGAAIANVVVADNFETWRSDGIGDKVKPDSSYTQEAQVERLTKLLGSKEQAEKFVKNGTIFLSKGHLTPRDDGVFHTWQHATYFYTNAVPQWNVINDGNWKSVEKRTRTIASLLQEDMIVIQGTSEVLSLPNTENQSVEVSLEDAGIEVPLWLWKIVKSPSRDAGIAFVTLNNPYETKQPESLLCPNVCEQYGWADKQYNDLAKGFTYCCDPNALIRMVVYAPEEGLVKNVLSLEMLSSNGIALQAWVHMLSIVGLVHVWRILV